MSNQQNIETVKENLLENAKISIQLGVEDYGLSKTDDKRKISAVRNIFSGLLLLYKYKLIMESPSDKPYIYITAINSKVTKEIYDGTFGEKTPTNTVDVHNIKKNLNNLGIRIDGNLLNSINKVRNNIEHFYHTQDVDILELIVKSFLLIENFYENHLKNNLEMSLKDFLGNEIYQLILENKDIYDKKLSECHQSFTNIEFPDDILKDIFIKNIECPYCLSHLIKYQSGDYENLSLHCTYCSNGQCLDKYDVLGLTHHAIKDGGDFREECPECGKYTIFLDNICLECAFEKDPNRDYERENYLNYLLEKDD